MLAPEPASRPEASRWALILAYDGRAFAGWQRQPQRASVQQALEDALGETCAQPIAVHASGRTDAGVHAAGQVVHFDAPASRARLGPENWVQALNTRLPAAVRVLAARPVAQDFHARFQAVGKVYHYHLWLDGPPDPRRGGQIWAPAGRVNRELLAETAHGLCGRHDFSGFAASRADGSDPPRGQPSVRCVHEIRLQEHGPWATLAVHGDGFHYRMVRLLVGGLVEVATGRFPAADLIALLDQPLDQPLRKSPFCAPPGGLSLERVHYPARDGISPLPHPWDAEKFAPSPLISSSVSPIAP